MKQYIIHLKTDDYEELAKELKVKQTKNAKETAVRILRDKSKASILKILESKLKTKEMVHIKNDSPLPFILLKLDESKLDELVDFLRKIDVVEMIEVDYSVLTENSEFVPRR